MDSDSTSGSDFSYLEEVFQTQVKNGQECNTYVSLSWGSSARENSRADVPKGNPQFRTH